MQLGIRMFFTEAAKAVVHGAKEMALDAIMFGTAAAAKASEIARGIAHKILGKFFRYISKCAYLNVVHNI